ncbi:hypothetical protein [Schumannella sp. 10F1B-5-1]|uniref:hypothetical protein n=1 Tax=Schumannella sp. 10F1B-5-1 TaxID=2590780 RepID=UPI00113127E7|nr:hypothetical protein [Schumannella sp. 10F1B-5-1]TPW78353.1 hypothetical protein FJ658_00660 [Schumannella sp. 10F1B-5-1]
MSDPTPDRTDTDADAVDDASTSDEVTEPNPPLPQLYGRDMQGHDTAAAERGEDVARADLEPGDDEAE